MYPKGGEMPRTIRQLVNVDGKPTEASQTATVHLANPTDFSVDDNFYVVPKAVDATRRP
jgi:hypothetical protein